MSRNTDARRPKLRLMADDVLERVIDEAEEILEKVGVRIGDEEALELLGNGGARIDKGNQQALIPRKLVEDCLKTVPPSFNLYDRSGNLHATLGEDNLYFTTVLNCTKIWDLDTGRLRGTSLKDVIDHVRVTDALKNIGISSTNHYFLDVPIQVGAWLRHFICLKYSTKPFWGSVYQTLHNAEIVNELLVAVRGSEKALREKPLMMFASTPLSPLQWGAEPCQFLMNIAKKAAPVGIVPWPTLGATAPITIAGGVTQGVVEGLSGIVMHQLANPGAPLLVECYTPVLDMRFGTTSIPAMEGFMGGVASTEVFKYLNIPTGLPSSIGDAKILDSQSGLESGIGIILGALAGANLILGAGGMSEIVISSLEKLVIDNEIAGMAYRLIKGISTGDGRLAEDLFTEGLFGGKHFLLSPNTVKWLKEEAWYPSKVISRESIDTWREKGGTTTEQRAREEAKRILATHQHEPLDRDVEKELTLIVKKYAERSGLSDLPIM